MGDNKGAGWRFPTDMTNSDKSGVNVGANSARQPLLFG
jgi:hypothetical protein